jgi:glyoxylase-like metal-dependent hydrolase (beta-lactamase superfamily II)
MPEIPPLTTALLPNGGWDERVLVCRRGTLVDVFAVVTRRYVVLIDTLDTPEAARALLDGVRNYLDDGRDLLVVNTHADWDHCWGNQIFAGPDAPRPAPIIAQRRCRERLLAPAAAAGLAEARAAEPARFGGVHLQPPTITFDGELAIDGGDLTLVLLHTPGHTADHVAVWLPEANLLLAGDTAEQPFPSLDGPAGIPALRDSLRRLAALAPTTVLACHAPGRHGPALLTDNLAYLDRLEAAARAALAAGLPADPPPDADAAALIGLPAEAAAPGGLPPGQAAYYRATHQAACRAMLTWLTAPPRSSG